jgi:hypothetical protein
MVGGISIEPICSLLASRFELVLIWFSVSELSIEIWLFYGSLWSPYPARSAFAAARDRLK